MPNAVIAGYVRTPFTLANKGALKSVRPDDLAGLVAAELVKRTRLNPADIEDIIAGCAFPEGEQGFNVGRIAGFIAGLPQEVAGCTINRWCGSSMNAIHQAAGNIAAGAGEVFLCLGVESMSRVPMGGFNPLLNPVLYEKKPDVYMPMGETAENLAKKYKIARKKQEEFALHSHQKAAAAQQKGHFKDEIMAIETKEGWVDKDGCVRADTTLEKMATLPLAFDQKGSVTAATSSPVTDGAAGVLVVSEDYAKKHGLPVLARIKAMAVQGCDPAVMGIGPVGASQKALARAGLTIKDIDVFELNEAFAAQAMAVVQELGVDETKLNLDGGAVAIGHPLGASGARITGKAAQVLKRTGGKYALASMCIGEGMGITTILEAV